jgi:hypothetical protein
LATSLVFLVGCAKQPSCSPDSSENYQNLASVHICAEILDASCKRQIWFMVHDGDGCVGSCTTKSSLSTLN